VSVQTSKLVESYYSIIYQILIELRVVLRFEETLLLPYGIDHKVIVFNLVLVRKLYFELISSLIKVNVLEA